VIRSRALSAPARRLLAALADSSGGWRHGYDLCREGGLKSGTLYPLLIRLEAQGHLEAEWRDAEEPGRPPRHVYRLTASGLRLAAANPVRDALAPERRPAERPA
jgi:PadR family transcriptional regulator, regulatory protein PadR